MEKHRHLFLRDLVFCSVVGICIGVFHIAAWYVSDPADPYAVFPVSSRSVMQWDETHRRALRDSQTRIPKGYALLSSSTTSDYIPQHAKVT